MKWTWKKGLLLSLLLAVAAEGLWLAVSPTHWLRKVDFGAVKVDEKPVDADIFFGEPDGEAEAIVLVHLKNGPHYFVSFGDEGIRQGDPSEYMRVFGGVWSFRSIRDGVYGSPLPPRNLNEFRIRTKDNHLVSIQL